MREEIEGCNGAESPVENGHDPKLHSLDRFGLENEFGLQDLEVDDEWDIGLLHLRR